MDFSSFRDKNQRGERVEIKEGNKRGIFELKLLKYTRARPTYAQEIHIRIKTTEFQENQTTQNTVVKHYFTTDLWKV